MSHGNLDQTVPQLPNVPTLELLRRHCYLKPMDIISMKESFLWGGGGGWGVGGGVGVYRHINIGSTCKGLVKRKSENSCFLAFNQNP